MSDNYLTWQTKVPTRAGLYIRSNGYGKVQLMHASIETFLDGSFRANLTDVIANYVRGPLDKPVPESIEPNMLLEHDTERTFHYFLGPIALPPLPKDEVLDAAEHKMPTQPGIYVLSRDHGHGRVHQLVAVSIHRYMIGQTAIDEVYGLDLPSLERRELKDDDLGVILTLALGYYRDLNLQMLPA